MHGPCPDKDRRPSGPCPEKYVVGMFFGGLGNFSRAYTSCWVHTFIETMALIGVEIWSVMIISVADLLLGPTSPLGNGGVCDPVIDWSKARESPILLGSLRPASNGERRNPVARHASCGKSRFKSLQRSGLSGNVCSGTRRRNIVTRRSMLLSAPALSNSCLARGREFAWSLRW